MIDYIAFFSRVVLGIVLLKAVVGKLEHRKQFTNNLQHSFSVPQSLLLPVFAVLILLEVGLFIGLVFGGKYLSSVFLAIALSFGAMTLLLLVMLLQNKVFQCACFGEPSHNVNFGDIARNGILVALAVSGFSSQHPLHGIIEQFLLMLSALPVSFVLIHFNLVYPVLRLRSTQ